MTRRELPRVLEIWQAAAVAAHPFLPPEYWRDSLPAVRDEYLPASQTFVCRRELEGDILGFISVMDGEHIGALFVDPVHQGQNVGSELLAYLKACYSYLTLAVYKENSSAVGFYLANGFVVLREQPNEDTGCPELCMQWAQRDVGLYGGDGAPPSRFQALG